MSTTATWLMHEFNIYGPDTTWNHVAGVYIFSGINTQNRWVALYIGQAESFRDRLSSHEQWEPAMRHGATHIHARVIPHAATRNAVERELIQACQPRLNTQLK